MSKIEAYASRLIEANDLFKRVNSLVPGFQQDTDENAALKNQMYSYGVSDAILEIQNSKTVDPKDFIPRGKWSHLGGDEWCCTNCGHVITTEGSWEHPLEIGAKHCENCGAKMDESVS